MNKFIKPLNMRFPDIRAFFSTRFAGDLEAIRRELDVQFEEMYVPVQRHTGRVHVLESDMNPVTADAVVTGRRRVLIGVQVADCVPVLLYDGRKHVSGAVHAGWKGTAARILANTIIKMRDIFNSSPPDILIAFGPSIRGCCYEVGEEVMAAVLKGPDERAGYSYRMNRHFIDLTSVNVAQAVSAGALPENIWQSGECTRCEPEKFHSYRFAGGATGRQYGLIALL